MVKKLIAVASSAFAFRQRDHPRSRAFHRMQLADDQLKGLVAEQDTRYCVGICESTLATPTRQALREVGILIQPFPHE